MVLGLWENDNDIRRYWDVYFMSSRCSLRIIVNTPLWLGKYSKLELTKVMSVSLITDSSSRGTSKTEKQLTG